jgi:AcrR family transcriptional regulator
MPPSRPAPAARRPPAPGAEGGLRERNKAAKRARIEHAARTLFARKGFEGATAREIAARAGVGLGTLFLYARDKRELLWRVFEEEARRRFAEARAAAPDAGLVDALMALFGRFLDFYARDPGLAAALLREFFFRPYEPERLGALTREYGAHVAQLVARARERGELRADVPVAVAASALFAHYAHWVQAWLGAGLVSREEAERRLRDALRLQIEGLRPPSAARRRRRRP